jgi:hypothetical protein
VVDVHHVELQGQILGTGILQPWSARGEQLTCRDAVHGRGCLLDLALAGAMP